MGFRCGIVGLPNVGKSTLFNALTATATAEAANYPFCTVEPNSGRVTVPDDRLNGIASFANSAAIVPAQIEFVDIAGLVAGASRGEGLGNRFLGHIREVDAIAHVLRCFEDGAITHVSGRVDPLTDAEVVDTELLLADLESLERRREPLIKKARGGDADARAMLALVERTAEALGDGQPARADRFRRRVARVSADAIADGETCHVRLQCRRSGGGFGQCAFRRGRPVRLAEKRGLCRDFSGDRGRTGAA